MLALMPGNGASANRMYLPPLEIVKSCDVVVLVRIESTRAHTWKQWRRVAQARVLATYKGRVPHRWLEIAFDNGLICPNVFYSPGEKCIATLSRSESAVYNPVHEGRLSEQELRAGMPLYSYIQSVRSAEPVYLLLCGVYIAWRGLRASRLVGRSRRVRCT